MDIVQAWFSCHYKEFDDLWKYTDFFPCGNRFEEPLANLLNERHRTVKELLEQLKMKKSSSKPQPEVERLKPQKETVHQALILDTAQRSRLQQQMQQARLSHCPVIASSPSLTLKLKGSSVVKSEMAVLLPVETGAIGPWVRKTLREEQEHR